MNSKNSLWKALGLGTQIQKVGFGKTLLHIYKIKLSEDPSEMEFLTWFGEKLPKSSFPANLGDRLFGSDWEQTQNTKITALFKALEKLGQNLPLKTSLHLYWNFHGTWLCEIEKLTHRKFYVNISLNSQNNFMSNSLKFHLETELQTRAFFERCDLLASWIDSRVVSQLNSASFPLKSSFEPKRDSSQQPC